MKLLILNHQKTIKTHQQETYKELKRSQSREEMWEEDYYEEHKRADKLYDEWKELMGKNDEN